jgi:single-strand DNA-binding protein
MAAPSSMLAQELSNMRPQAYGGAAEDPAVLHEVDWSANNANYISMIGTLGTDPEVKELAGGVLVAKMRMAHRTPKKTTEWYNVDAWDRWAEAIRAAGLRKGQQILVEGKLRTDEWSDRATGQKRSAVRVVASQISIVRPWGGGGGGQ